MNREVLACELFGLIVLLIILYSVQFETKHRSKKQQAFLILIFSVMLTILVDAIQYLPIDWSKYRTIQHILIVSTFIVPLFVASIFLQYVHIHISSKTKVNKKLFIGGSVYCLFQSLMALHYCIAGKLYVINDEGVYSLGDYYNGYLYAYLIILVYIIILVLLYIKQIGIHDAVAAVMFILVPTIFVIINAFIPEFTFNIAALTISMLIIFIMLQGERESTLIARELATSKQAHYDELTGLLNRLAFNELCDTMGGNGEIGVIFGDLNGLKYANDHYGHKAGDDLLCEFARLLVGNFRRDDVFRISGDEFVVVLRGMPLETFERKCKELESKINGKYIPIASVGYVHGSESEISRLIDMAEENMYINKKKFHSEHPDYSRQE